jgi:hypothetical protein
VQRASNLAEDVREDGWPVERADAVLCIDMVYIAPWEVGQIGNVRLAPPERRPRLETAVAAAK